MKSTEEEFKDLERYRSKAMVTVAEAQNKIDALGRDYKDRLERYLVANLIEDQLLSINLILSTVAVFTNGLEFFYDTPGGEFCESYSLPWKYVNMDDEEFDNAMKELEVKNDVDRRKYQQEVAEAKFQRRKLYEELKLEFEV